MKKLLLLLVLLWWPVAAWALPDTPYDPETMLLYPRMTQEQQHLFDLIYRAALQGQERVTLPENTAYDEAKMVMDAVLDDCPELCALDPQYSLMYYQDAPEVAVHIGLAYIMPVENQQTLVEAARQAAESAWGDEFQREVYLHDWLCDQVTYDLAASNAHNAWGALMEGRAVCDGYAKAMALLLRLSYIESGVVRGESLDGQVKHAWNMVKVDGSYAWLDATNNDQPEMITYFHLNITDEWLKRSYRLQTDWPLPACGDESISWHGRNWRLVEDTADMELHIFNNFRNMVLDGSVFNLRFRNEEDYLSLRDGVSRWAEKFNQQSDVQVEGILHTYCNDAQRCLVVLLER